MLAIRYVTAAVALVTGLTVHAATADYPNKPIRLVVAFSAGGTTDLLARDMANQLTQNLKQTVVVENKPGAGGNIGSEFVAGTAPDGYTILASSVGPIAINPTLFKKLRVNPLTDLMAVAPIADVPNVLVVNNDLPIKTVKDLVDYAKAQNGKVNFGSTGVGTAAHLSGVLLNENAKIDTTHIPYKGAEALNDLIAGRLQYMFATLPSVIAHIRAGQVRAIAIAGKARSPALPNVPTVEESSIPNVVTGSWFGTFVPKGTPVAIVDKLSKAITEVISDPKMRKRFQDLGAEPMLMSPQQFQKFVLDDSARWKPIILRSGASVD